MFAEIALPGTGYKTFTYLVPERYRSAVAPGVPVAVSLRNSLLIGVVISLSSKSDIPKKRLKEIRGLVDPAFNLDKHRLEFLNWIAEYYLCPVGEVFRSAYPPGFIGRANLMVMASNNKPSDKKQQFVYEKIKARANGCPFTKKKPILPGVSNSLIEKMIRSGHLYLSGIRKTQKPAIRLVAVVQPGNCIADKFGKDSAEARELAVLLEDEPNGVTISQLIEFGFKRSLINRLEKCGVLKIIRQSEEAIISPISIKTNIMPNPDQQAAIETIIKSIQNKEQVTYLLFGVTGSGKTQVYIEAARKALALGKSILILLPEISLTPQAIKRFSESLGCPIGIWHSKISSGQRADLYLKAQSGQLRVVLGVRSAVFAPMQNLGLIIVDEEQDDSYKQSEPPPRYNARDTALMRARIEGALTILGSATPSIESYYNAQTGKYRFVCLPKRFDGAPMPKAITIDLKKAEIDEGHWPLSEPFIEQMCINIADEKQVILLLNRRGYAGILMCKTCGWIALCDDCKVAMTYHKPETGLRCHFCGSNQNAPAVCPKCTGHEFDYRGIGTQKLEEMLVEILGAKGIMRMDSDSTSRKGSLEKIISTFELGEKPVLLGTRMVAKGHHFPNVGMVGVVLADAGMHLPDFRASEKVFQLLVQAAGRAGRSAQMTNGGEFIVQSYNPTSGLLEYAVNQDYVLFYNKEIEYRRELGYPPFGKIIRLVISGDDDSITRWAAKKAVKDILPQIKTGKALGPAPTGVFRLGKKYHYQVLLKGKFSADFKIWLKEYLANWHPSKEKEVLIKADIDPREMI